jgi:hypothetical protein
VTVFFRYKFNLCLWLFWVLHIICFSAEAAVPLVDFTLEDIRHPAFTIHSAHIRLLVIPSPTLEINLGELVLGDKKWRNLQLKCHRIHVSTQLIDCAAGRLQLGAQALSLTFQLSRQHRQFVLEIQPLPLRQPMEKWHLTVDWQEKKWRSVLKIINGEGRFLADLLPQLEDQIQVQQAKLNGNIHINGDVASVSTLHAQLHISELSFNNASGLHAGEQVGLHLDLNVRKRRNVWLWRSKFYWSDGEIFWQPFYFAGEGHQLIARGVVRDQRVRITQAKLNVTGIGEVDFSAVVDMPSRTVQQANLSAKNMVLSTLFANVIRPLALETALAETEATGQVSVVWRYQGEHNQSLTLGLQDVSVADTHGRFAVDGLNVYLPWDNGESQYGLIQFNSGQILEVPLGETTLSIETKGMTINVPHAEVPILDGELQIKDFSAVLHTSGWQWQFSGKLLPISMERLTESLKIQPMFGTLSGTIPKMSYVDSTVLMEGELVSGIFDGVAVARNLVLTKPLSMTPHLVADIALYHIDLDLLTRAYSFGNIQGRVDIEVNDLELVNWEPVKFDAKLASSKGDYKRRISQAAIKNIIALGGNSAVSIIQRSFLGFFEQFRYADIGWGCKLRGHICYMSGIESTVQASKGYVLVKGSGIPAITITGYNSEVDWPELLKRLEHAIESGVPVIH